MADRPTSRERRERVTSRRDLRRHPVTQMLRHASSGGVPSEPDLDELRLPPAVRRRLSDHCQAIAALRASGENAEARRMADAAADQIVGNLPDELRAADYLRPADDTPSDPAGLAALVRRT